MNYQDFDRLDRKKRGDKVIIRLVTWIVLLAALIGLGYVTARVSIGKTTMSGSSMETTLQSGDRIIINKLSYKIGNPKRFDVIVFKQDGSEHSYYNVKRVIGLPEESVQIIDGSVYIDGELLEEDINVESIYIPGLAEEIIYLEENEYFVLGDSRNDSEDSRFANIGNVVSSDIIGKAWIRSKPSISIISKMNLKEEPLDELDELDDDSDDDIVERDGE